jgi:hypothetical protein
MTEVPSTEQKKSNLLGIAQATLHELRGADFRVRRRGIMYIATLLGHKLGPEQLRDQAWGTVGECENCGCVGKASHAGPSIDGRATTTFCSARGT